MHGYRDSLVLLLRFLSGRHKRPIAELDLKDLEPAGILAFLSHLEKERISHYPSHGSFLIVANTKNLHPEEAHFYNASSISPEKAR
jgi:hypothetical protein